MKNINQRILVIAIIVLAVLVCMFAIWKLQSPTSTAIATPPVDKAALAKVALARLQANMQNVTPHFIDANRVNAQSLTPEESEIKDDIIGLFITENPGESEDYYSTIWLNGVGKRYILA